MQTDADTEAGRGEGPPTREQMADHVEDIGQRLQAGDLSPEKAGGALQYLARRLRQSDPGGEVPERIERLMHRSDRMDRVKEKYAAGEPPIVAPTDEAPEGEHRWIDFKEHPTEDRVLGLCKCGETEEWAAWEKDPPCPAAPPVEEDGDG